jgi:hypothetical protein
MENMRKACIISVGKPEGKRPLPIHRRRLEESVEMCLRGRGWKFVDWMHLTQDRDQWLALVNTVMNLLVP